MIVSTLRESLADERRVALVPELLPRLIKAGLEVQIEAGAGEAAGFLDSTYQDAGAKIVPDPLPGADAILKVQPPTLDEIGQEKQRVSERLLGHKQTRLSPMSTIDLVDPADDSGCAPVGLLHTGLVEDHAL